MRTGCEFRPNTERILEVAQQKPQNDKRARRCYRCDPLGHVREQIAGSGRLPLRRVGDGDRRIFACEVEQEHDVTPVPGTPHDGYDFGVAETASRGQSNVSRFFLLDGVLRLASHHSPQGENRIRWGVRSCHLPRKLPLIRSISIPYTRESPRLLVSGPSRFETSGPVVDLRPHRDRSILILK